MWSSEMIAREVIGENVLQIDFVQYDRMTVTFLASGAYNSRSVRVSPEGTIARGCHTKSSMTTSVAIG